MGRVLDLTEFIPHAVGLQGGIILKEKFLLKVFVLLSEYSVEVSDSVVGSDEGLFDEVDFSFELDYLSFHRL